ncbi:hypothetical protein SAMN06264346_10860 [Chryseobacterium profundimaris]|uniref:Uncharacterized protein n=1 Tax=Chryseobacterium profundimaris TaxID=1387275 RepID=A0ABY1P5K0_9FLAO|nr:hypothetical protein SAMN06264346_10860 [Chryseobacterium profundimaris]
MKRLNCYYLKYPAGFSDYADFMLERFFVKIFMPEASILIFLLLLICKFLFAASFYIEFEKDNQVNLLIESPI